ncbi:MAG: hypothetical protein RJA69_607, partial [Pseudomonadota bacterium]
MQRGLSHEVPAVQVKACSDKWATWWAISPGVVTQTNPSRRAWAR